MSSLNVSGITTLNNGLVVYNSRTWQTSVNIDDANGNNFQFNTGGSANTAIGTNAMGIYDGSAAVNNYVIAF